MSRQKSQATPLASEGTDRMDQRVNAVVDAVGAFIEAWGFRAIHGRVWALLALRKSPMPQAEIAEFLGVSRSLISLAISELTKLGLVRQVGSARNAPYEALLDVWPTITDVVRNREWMLIERARIALEAAAHEAEFSQEMGQSTSFDADRIRLLLTMSEFAQTVLRLLFAVRMPRALDDFGSWLVKTRRTIETVQSKVHRLL